MTNHIINYRTNFCTLKTFQAVLIAILIFYTCNIKAQESYFPVSLSDDSIYFSLARYHELMTKAEIAEFSEKQPPKILDYIPTFGIYAVPIDGKIKTAPRLSWSMSAILSRKRKNNLNEAKIMSINRKALIQMETDYQKCLALKRQIMTINEKLRHLKELESLDRKIYQYDSVKYLNQELNPDQFYDSKKKLMNSQYRILTELEKLESKIIQLKLTARINEN